jgi:hypothetical protein
MKILLLVPDKTDAFVEYATLNTELCDQKVTIVRFRDLADINKYDAIFVYPGSGFSGVNTSTFKRAIPSRIYSILTHDNATVIFKYHYDCNYKGISNTHRVVPKQLMMNPYATLYALSNYEVYEKYQVQSKRFILSVNNTIACFVTCDGNFDKTIASVMPVIPTSDKYKANFEIEAFFRKAYLTISELQQIGDFFWKIQHYQVWDSFYDFLCRHTV